MFIEFSKDYNEFVFFDEEDQSAINTAHPAGGALLSLSKWLTGLKISNQVEEIQAGEIIDLFEQLNYDISESEEELAEKLQIIKELVNITKALGIVSSIDSDNLKGFSEVMGLP